MYSESLEVPTMFWKWFAATLTAAALLLQISCSGQSALPKAGSPAYYWSNAKAAYKAGDLVKTDEELQRILVGESEFTARARVWDMVTSGGLAQGYSALSDAYDAGARANRQNPLPYRKRVSELRTLAGNMSIQLADGVHKYLETDKEPNALMSFPFPAGSASEPAGLLRVTKALFVKDSEQAQLQTAMLQRGVVLALCRTTGNEEDAAKTLQLFQAPEIRVPRETLLLGSARILQETSDVFTDKKLDLPNKLKIVLQEATAALKAVPATKETKVITEKIQKSLKKANLTSAL